MSLARAFTKRSKRPEKTPAPLRSMSVRKPGQAIDRNQISSPVALLSTTNPLSYNAPDIISPKLQARSVSSSSTSTHSSDTSDSDKSSASSISNKSQETLTDASSVDSMPPSPEPNHLSCYFQAAQNKGPRRSVSSINLNQAAKLSDTEAPAIPHRALSHSKRAHEQLARKRSLQHMPGRSPSRSPSISRSLTSARSSRDAKPITAPASPAFVLHSTRGSREHRTSIDMFKPAAVEPNHPFGPELEKLNEVAEEFGSVVKDVEHQEDLKTMREKNLATFCAADYLAEIQPLIAGFLGARYLTVDAGWI